MIPFRFDARAPLALTLLIGATLAAPGLAAAQTPPPAQGDGRGLVIQPAQPPGGTTAYGGLVTTPNGGATPAPPGGSSTALGGLLTTSPGASAPQPTLEQVVNTPGVTTDDIMNALNDYWYSSGNGGHEGGAPVPLITPTADHSYSQAAAAEAARINQVLSPSERLLEAHAMGAAQNMPAGAQRDEAMQQAYQLQIAAAQRDADFVFYQDVTTAAQLKADGHPGAAIVIIPTRSPEILVDEAKTHYQVSQAALDTAWANYQAASGMSRDQVMSQYPSNNEQASTSNASQTGDASATTPAVGVSAGNAVGQPTQQGDSPASSPAVDQGGANFVMPPTFVPSNTSNTTETADIAAVDAMELAALVAISSAGDPSGSGMVGVARLAPIYRNYAVNQPGSSVIAVPSTQVQTPSSVMTVPSNQVQVPSNQLNVPSNQVLVPSNVMQVPSLQPSLCGR